LAVSKKQEARNIEKSFAPGHKNVHFLRQVPECHNSSVGHCKSEALAEYQKVIKAKGEFKKVPLDSRVPDKTVCIGAEASQLEQEELLAFLDKNINVFT
jgi:hypothetical protein